MFLTNKLNLGIYWSFLEKTNSNISILCPFKTAKRSNVWDWKIVISWDDSFCLGQAQANI